MKDNPLIWIAVLGLFIFLGYVWDRWTKNYLQRLAADEALLRDNRLADPNSPSHVNPDTFK